MYKRQGQISPKSLGVDANTLLYQVPGGMFSNMLKQLKDAGKEDKLDEVLAEIPRVREDAGLSLIHISRRLWAGQGNRMPAQR